MADDRNRNGPMIIDANLNAPSSSTYPVKSNKSVEDPAPSPAPSGHELLLRTEPLSLGQSLLSLEPAMVTHMIASILVYMTVQDVLLEKACRVELRYPKTVCDALQARNTDGYEKQEQAIQSLMGQAMMYRTILENLFPAFLVFLVGAWSDKYGRKYPMLLVIASFILQDVLLIGCMIAGDRIGTKSIILISSLVISLSGNQPCFMTCAFSYVNDHTPPGERMSRQGFTLSFFSLSITLGLAAGGILARSGLPFHVIFWIGLGLELFALLYLSLSMENHPQRGATQGKSKSRIFLELFNLQHVRDAGASLFKKREGKARQKLGLLLLSHVCSNMLIMGEMAVLYLFCRYQFNWDAATFGSFMSYRTVMSFLGNFISLGVLGGWLGISETLNGIIACVSIFGSSLALSVAKTSFWIMLDPIVTLLGGPALIVPRSMLSQLVPADEHGKINACIGSLDCVIPLVASCLYTKVYTFFLGVMPGSIFLISAALTLPQICVYCWFRLTEEPVPQEEVKED